MTDTHKTTTQLVPLSSLDEGASFAVSVTRDDNLTGENDELLGSKFHQVLVVFDVTPTGQVSCNGAPVKMGVSTIMMTTGTIYGITSQGLSTLSREELESAYDVGVVAMQVMAMKEDRFDEDYGDYIQRITIGERIFELNGNKVTQQTLAEDSDDLVMGQIIDVYPDGSMKRQEACPMAVGKFVFGTSGKIGKAMHKVYIAAVKTATKAYNVTAETATKAYTEAVKSYKSLPTSTQRALVITSRVLLCVQIALWSVAGILTIIRCAYDRRNNKVIGDTEASALFVTEVGEKSSLGKAAEAEVDALPSYTTTITTVKGYSAVAAGEEEAAAKEEGQ